MSSTNSVKARGPNAYSVKVFWFSDDGVTICSVLPRTFYFILVSCLAVSAILIWLFPLLGAASWWATLGIAYLLVEGRRRRLPIPDRQGPRQRTNAKIEWSSVTGIELVGRRVNILTKRRKYQAILSKGLVSDFHNLVRSKNVDGLNVQGFDTVEG
jgi:hypothetical protein